MRPSENMQIAVPPNFRDIGGYEAGCGSILRKGILYRSGHLSELTPTDLVMLSELGLKTVIDLRTPKEIKSQPDRIISKTVSNVEIPMIPSWGDPGKITRFLMLFRRRSTNETFIREFYKQIVFNHKIQMKRIFEIISDQKNLPSLIHCTAGKDRTGITVALIHLLCGVSEKDMLHDYLLTNTLLGAGVKNVLRENKLLNLFNISMEKIQPLLEAKADYLLDVLVLVNKTYGSVGEYLTAGCGIDQHTLEKLKRILIKKSP